MTTTVRDKPEVVASACPPRAAPMTPVPLRTLPARPCISIIIPSYNQGAFIRETIESILSQDYRPVQIVVIDGASTDDTVAILEGYRGVPEIEWVSEPDRGVVDAVNKGFARAKGDILAIQSSDDYYLPDSLGTMVSFLREHPTVGLAYGDIITVDRQGQERHRTTHPPYSLEGFLGKRFYIPQPAAFFRREMIEALGGWDERYFVADTQLWLRMVFRTEVGKVNACLAKRRLHDGQRNHQAARIVDSYRRMIADSAEIAASPYRLRRAARAGVHLHTVRYNPSNSYLRSSLHLWQALLLEPSQFGRWQRSPLLVPGYLSLKVLGARMKQRLGFGS